jgi:hypothetical protein
MTEGIWNIPLRSPRDDDTMSMPHLVRHRSMIFGSARVQPMEIKRASVWKVLALPKTEAVKCLSITGRWTMTQ